MLCCEFCTQLLGTLLCNYGALNRVHKPHHLPSIPLCCTFTLRPLLALFLSPSLPPSFLSCFLTGSSSADGQVRPILPSEGLEGKDSCVSITDRDQLIIGRDRQFRFDHVFPPSSSQVKCVDRELNHVHMYPSFSLPPPRPTPPPTCTYIVHCADVSMEMCIQVLLPNHMYITTEMELPCSSGERRSLPCINQPAQLSCLGGSVGRVSA